MQTRDTKRTTLHPSAEAIVNSMERTVLLQQRPIGDLSPEERAIALRAHQFLNDQARRELAAKTDRRLPAFTLCPVHKTRFEIVSGDRYEDCSFCRVWKENNEHRCDDLREEGGMAASAPRNLPFGAGDALDAHIATDGGDGGGWTRRDERLATLADWIGRGVLLLVVVGLASLLFRGTGR